MLRSTNRVAAGALMIAGLGLAATPLAASAHTGNLFTWAYSETSNAFGITDISTSNAALTQLHPASFEDYVSGADICNETAWAVIDGNAENEVPAVAIWDHSTGVISAEQHDLTADIADFPGSSDVDSTEAYAADSLSDCTAIAYVRYEIVEGENTTYPLFVSAINLTTGRTTPLVELPELSNEQFISWDGIATNHVSGVTYLFAQFQGTTHVSVLDTANGTVSALEQLDGLYAFYDESGTRPLEADFQPDGKLWLILGVDQLEEYRLVSFAAGSDLLTASPTDVGNPNEGDSPMFYEGDRVLTYDPEALANTGGGAPLGLLVPAGVLFSAGLMLLVVHRGARTAA